MLSIVTPAAAVRSAAGAGLCPAGGPASSVAVDPTKEGAHGGTLGSPMQTQEILEVVAGAEALS
jgi:hypothetical protein